LKHSYHDEGLWVKENWMESNNAAHIAYRKSSTWFQLLGQAGFEITGYHEPAPKNMNWGHNDPERYYSIQKRS